MKNKVRILLFLFILSLFLVGCGAKKEVASIDRNDENKSDVVEEEESAPNRKIIYKVNAEFYTDNISKSVKEIKNELKSDEWLDLETISSERAELVIRIKSERLEEFLSSISQNHEFSTFNKTATDVSLNYQDKSNLILTYQAEQQRLLELYEEASLSDMITINKRLSEIEIQIAKLQGQLNQYDSLIDYSEVSLKLYQTEKEESVTFGKRLFSGLTNGFKALIVFLEVLIIILVTLLPWMLVIAPTWYGIYRIIKHHKNKKRQKNEVNKGVAVNKQ